MPGSVDALGRPVCLDRGMTDSPAPEAPYGSAADVPALLDRFAADPPGVWAELMDRLCPMLDTAFPESFAALPRLARIAAARPPAERRWVLAAAGPIVRCARWSAAGAAVRETHAAAIAELARLTDECLRPPLGMAEYAGLLQDALAFEGVAVWDECLERLAEGEYEVACPYCGVNLFLVIGDDGFFSCADDYALGEAERTPLRPADAALPAGPGARLYTRALADGQPAFAERLLYLFGQGACTHCGTEFAVADRVADVVSPDPGAPGS
ncbi:hypothetical protein L0F81_05795 [Streptomyces tricolor]|uniref:DUF1963 domain-containing protein n=1 Tax=Streptomyces tricolor TaxID=68277 RepID=A0ABS9JB85_9ACTN|nr:hypothetical protein [Streptomyces tricolor]MCG0062804.1 hypothetical protein [Streptomyces tricolor]